MPHKGKKRYKNKEKPAINTTKKKRKRVKLKSLQKSGRLIIKNLPFKATENVLKEYLKKFGDICEVKLLKKSDGSPIGLGFVQFTKEDNAAKARQNCNGTDFLGRKIVIDWAMPRSEPENNSGIKQELEEGVSLKEEPDSEEECVSKVKNEKKSDVSNTELSKSLPTKEHKKSKNTKKGRLIVRNLPFKATEKILRKHFEKCGEINEVTLLRKANGKLVGCGFIQFVRKNSAAKAILNCSGKPFLGRTIILDWAVPKSTFIGANETSGKEKNEMNKDSDDHHDDEDDNDHDDEDDDDSDDDEVPKKQLASHIDDNDIQDVKVKKELLTDESEEENDDNSYTDDSLESDEKSIKEESDEDSKQKVVIKKPKVFSNDVSEGRTVFIKNVPFAANNEDLKTCMEQFGEVVYALICMDHVTEHSKGTAFVKFKTKESAEQCLCAGTELMLHDQVLDVFRALNKEELQNKMDNKNDKTKDSRNLYLVKEGVILAGSKAAVGVSTTDMAKRLQLEQWKTQMLRNLNMFVSRLRLVIHNLPPSWNDKKLHQIFLQHAGPKAVIKEARVMRDLKNVDAQGVGKSKEYGFVSFANHDDALKALRNINNNPNIFTTAKRPIVAFSIENKAIMNIKQKRLEKSKLKNPICSDQNSSNFRSRKSKSKNQESTKQKSVVSDKSGEEVEAFVGVAAKPGKTKMRSRFGFKSQAKIHKQTLRKAKHERKLKRRSDLQKQNIKEKMRESQPKKGVKRKLDNDDKTFNTLVSNYKKKLMAAPSKKWYDE